MSNKKSKKNSKAIRPKQKYNKNEQNNKDLPLIEQSLNNKMIYYLDSLMLGIFGYRYLKWNLKFEKWAIKHHNQNNKKVSKK